MHARESNMHPYCTWLFQPDVLCGEGFGVHLHGNMKGKVSADPECKFQETNCVIFTHNMLRAGKWYSKNDPY